MTSSVARGGLAAGDRVVLTSENGATFADRLKSKGGVVVRVVNFNYVIVQRDGISRPERWAASWWDKATDQHLAKHDE